MGKNNLALGILRSWEQQMNFLRKSFRGKKSAGDCKLLEAVLANDETAVFSLLAHPKADPNTARPSDGCTPLHAACNGFFTQ